MPTEPLKIATGDAAGVAFLRDDVRYDVHDKYGKSWSYMVSYNGPNGVENRSLRAYDGLQYALLDAKVSKDMRAVIHRKAGEGNLVVWDIDVHADGDGKPITVKDWDGNLLSAELLSPDTENEPASAPNAASAPPAASNGNGPTLQQLKQLALWSVDTAIQAWGDRGTSDNQQGTASTLLIAAKDLRMWEKLATPQQEATQTAVAVMDGEQVPPPVDDDLPF